MDAPGRAGGWNLVESAFPMGLSAILFDFGGTLDSDGIPWPRRFFPIYRKVGVAADWNAFLKAFYRSDDSLAQRHRLAGLDLAQTVERQAAGVLEVLAPDRLELAAEVSRAFTAECRAQFARNRPVLEALGRRFKLGVVSNFYGNLEELLAAEGLGTIFAATADSGAVGSVKPDAAIFRHALERMGASPEQALMIGDSLERDIRGAEALGMSHAWLDPEGRGVCCASGRTIRSLSELSDLAAEVPAGGPR